VAFSWRNNSRNFVFFSTKVKPTTICLALGENRPQYSDANAPTASPPKAQKTRLEDEGDADPDPNCGRVWKTQGLLNPKPSGPVLYARSNATIKKARSAGEQGEFSVGLSARRDVASQPAK
jgi:hypothetical protein